MNAALFLTGQKKLLLANDQFCAFGGPCVYFHLECLRAGSEAFLSQRHIEMVYATLTAWGMHRMGDAQTTKTKLADWERFQASLVATAPALAEFRGCRLLEMSESQYSEAVLRLSAVDPTTDARLVGALA